MGPLESSLHIRRRCYYCHILQSTAEAYKAMTPSPAAAPKLLLRFARLLTRLLQSCLAFSCVGCCTSALSIRAAIRLLWCDVGVPCACVGSGSLPAEEPRNALVRLLASCPLADPAALGGSSGPAAVLVAAHEQCPGPATAWQMSLGVALHCYRHMQIVQLMSTCSTDKQDASLGAMWCSSASRPDMQCSQAWMPWQSWCNNCPEHRHSTDMTRLQAH